MDINPSGFTAAADFGTTYANQRQLARHVVVSFGTPLVSQTQLARHVVVAFGSVSLAIPRGAAFTTAFGTPTVTMVSTATAAPTITTLAGLGLARRHYEGLVEEWHRLNKLREELEARQERLSREKTAAKRERRHASVVDFSAERRLDELIVACNRAYATLQEREDEVYAGVRAHLADMKDIGDENRRALQSIETSYQAMLQADDEDVMLALM